MTTASSTDLNIIFIDHYDSFADILMDYFKRLHCNITKIFTDQIDIQTIDANDPCAIVIGPGHGHPLDKDLLDVYTVIDYFESKIPILGVCLGHQIIAQYYTANVIKAPRIMHGRISTVTYNDNVLFYNLPQSFQVTRYHSLIVQQNTLKRPLQMTGWSWFESQLEIMSFKHENSPIYGVQFHPEAICTNNGLAIINNFRGLLHA